MYDSRAECLVGGAWKSENGSFLDVLEVDALELFELLDPLEDVDLCDPVDRCLPSGPTVFKSSEGAYENSESIYVVVK